MIILQCTQVASGGSLTSNLKWCRTDIEGLSVDDNAYEELEKEMEAKDWKSMSCREAIGPLEEILTKCKEISTRYTSFKFRTVVAHKIK